MQYNPYIQKYERKIISEGVEDNVKSSLQKLFDFVVDIIKKSEQYYGLNVKFLVTWGASLGGMILPLKQWIEGEYPELNEKQIILLLVGIACNYFYDNEKFIRGVLDKIKEEGLLPYFQKLFEKSEELNKKFSDFMNSVKTFGITMTNIVSYAFILPILDDIISIANSQNVEESTEFLIKRIIASGVVMISGITLVNFLKKLIEHFRKD